VRLLITHGSGIRRTTRANGCVLADGIRLCLQLTEALRGAPLEVATNFRPTIVDRAAKADAPIDALDLESPTMTVTHFHKRADPDEVSQPLRILTKSGPVVTRDPNVFFRT
jgi:hypothetical protein